MLDLEGRKISFLSLGHVWIAVKSENLKKTEPERQRGNYSPALRLGSASGADGDRTRNLVNAIHARSQLRHGPKHFPKL